MIPYYDDVSKRRELEYCLKLIEFEKSRMKNFNGLAMLRILRNEKYGI